MRNFYCNGKFVAQSAGIPVAKDDGSFLAVPDFVCDAIADIRMYESAELKFSWQGTGLNQDGEFETWMIQKPKKQRPIIHLISEMQPQNAAKLQQAGAWRSRKSAAKVWTADLKRKPCETARC